MKKKIEITKIIKQFGKNAKDTGSTEVQIAVLTSEIESLKSHFKENKKDFHSRRGFIAKIEKRKKLLNYLKRKNFDSYQNTIEKLGIRK